MANTQNKQTRKNIQASILRQAHGETHENCGKHTKKHTKTAASTKEEPAYAQHTVQVSKKDKASHTHILPSAHHANGDADEQHDDDNDDDDERPEREDTAEELVVGGRFRAVCVKNGNTRKKLD